MIRKLQLALVLLAIVSIVSALGGYRVALAAPAPQPIDVAPRPIHPVPITRATPPPLPFASPTGSPGAQATLAPTTSGSLPTGIPAGIPEATGWTINKNLKLPAHVPKLSQFLMKAGKGRYGVRQVRTGSAARMAPMINLSGSRSVRSMAASNAARTVRPMSADGSTILLTGDQTNFFENDITLSYGQEIYVLCENMATTDRVYYVLFPPDGSGPYVSSQIRVYSDGSGNNYCGSYGQFNLSTPFGGFGGSSVNGTSYPGVWVIATYDSTTGTYTSETNIVASSSVNFSTYSDVAESNPTTDFNPGSVIAVGATGLNPSHYYAVGWVYTSGSGQPCAYSVPTGNTSNVVCFTSGATGVQAFSGNIEEWWDSSSSPSTSSASTGTYDVELYDTTTNEMIGHQQISLQSSSVSWTLTPYSSTGATPPPGLAYNNIFATDGLTDGSTTGLTYAVSGLGSGTNGNTLYFSIADPNGAVLTSPNNTNGYPWQYALSVNNSATQSSGGASKKIAFPADFGEQMAYGPTQNPFAPNVFSAQLYDKNNGSVLGAKSFQVLAYAAGFSWASGTIVNASPGTGNTETVTITNTGNQNYGTWNGDGINGVEIAPNSNYNEQLGLVDTTATDSAGNTWTIFSSGSGSNEKIFAEPTSLSSGANIPVGGTLSFKITIQIANGGSCTSSPCYFDTMIRPRHGVAYSGASSVSNALGVLANGVSVSSVAATGSWSVQSETATSNMAARRSYFDKLAYILGTANSPATDSYSINLTINNASSPDGHKLMDVKVTMPSVLDINTYTPTITSSPSGTGTWHIVTNSSYNHTGYSLGGANVFEIACEPNTRDSCGMTAGTTGTFTLSFPLFTGSFAEQETAMTANWDGGDGGTNNCGNCSAKSYALNATTTTVNGIAGQTSTDSLMLGGFSLNPTLMYMVFSPSTVGTGVATSATMVFTNTSTSQDPNPDYVDQINLVIPSTMGDPASITVPSGWIATKTSSLHWQIALCAAPTASTPCSSTESSAIAPGGSLTFTLNYNSPGPPAGTYSVTWYATGANGGENTSAISSTANVTFSTTSASVSFTTVNGTSVTSGTEPQVGTDATTSGSTFVYKITNTGSSSLTGAAITIPYQTRAGTSGKDGNGQYWQITSAPTVVLSGGTGTSGTCNGTLNAAQYASASGTGNGNITLTGCSIPTNGTITITFVAHAPYLIGSDFLFSTNVTGSGTIAAQPSYSSSNAMLIVINGTLSILTPGNGSVGGANVLTSATGSGATPSTSCTGCSVTTGSPNLIDFGVFSGTFSATDIIDASVSSDAYSPNSWTLYISASSNPSNMLYAQVHSATSTSATGLTYSATSYTVVPTTSPGQQLTTYTGTGRRNPADTIQNFQVVTGGNTSAESVTITYTLVFN